MDVKVGVGIIVKRGNKILVGKRHSKHAHGVGTWCTPGGHVEFNESPEHTCIRELFEETGVLINNTKDITFIGYTNDMFLSEQKHYITLWYMVLYSKCSGKEQCTKELVKLKWCTWDNIPKPLFKSTENYIKKFILK